MLIVRVNNIFVFRSYNNILYNYKNFRTSGYRRIQHHLVGNPTTATGITSNSRTAGSSSVTRPCELDGRNDVSACHQVREQDARNLGPALVAGSVQVCEGARS